MKNNKIDILEKQQELYENTGDYTQEFIDDYKQAENKYLSDLISEFADGSISIYKSDIIDYYYNNKDICNQAAQEFGILESFDFKNDDIDDLTERAGAAGWYMNIENNLYKYYDDIIIGLCYQYLMDHGIYKLSNKDFKKLNDIASSYYSYNCDRLIELYDELKEFIDDNKIGIDLYTIEKNNLRQEAINWQDELRYIDISYSELAVKQNYFYKQAKKYGLVKEFKENGIL